VELPRNWISSNEVFEVQFAVKFAVDKRGTDMRSRSYRTSTSCSLENRDNSVYRIQVYGMNGIYLDPSIRLKKVLGFLSFSH
jgi:hypothetical protein